jgi:hypothetical protein
MGDHYERIVDVEVSGADAGPLAARMVDWLVAERVLTRETTGEGVYSPYADEGFVPGPGWGAAVPEALRAGWTPGPVAVAVGRRYHVGGQGADEAEWARCPRCRARTVITDYPRRFEPDRELWRPFRAAIAHWEATGEGSAGCGACGASVPVTAWEWDESFALGALAFDFWGWPPLSDAFQDAFRRRLGHRTATHQGKF